LDVGELFGVLGIPVESLQRVQAAKTEAQAQELLDALQARVRRGVRQIARVCHPDVTGGDLPSEALLREVLEAAREVEGWQVVRRCAVPLMRASLERDDYARRYDYSYGESSESE
jgi:hypothetical protein